MPASAATLDRIRESGSIKLGYLADARPFSFRNEAGAAEGYAVTLCQQVADQVKKGLALPSLSVEWVPVTPDNRLSDVQQRQCRSAVRADQRDTGKETGRLVLDPHFCGRQPCGAACGRSRRVARGAG